MKIVSLEQMEDIVSKNKWLQWDGWTVISYRYNPVAWSKKDGAFYKGKWYNTQRFELTEHGWDIPKSLAR